MRQIRAIQWVVLSAAVGLAPNALGITPTAAGAIRETGRSRPGLAELARWYRSIFRQHAWNARPPSALQSMLRERHIRPYVVAKVLGDIRSARPGFDIDTDTLGLFYQTLGLPSGSARTALLSSIEAEFRDLPTGRQTCRTHDELVAVCNRGVITAKTLLQPSHHETQRTGASYPAGLPQGHDPSWRINSFGYPLNGNGFAGTSGLSAYSHTVRVGAEKKPGWSILLFAAGDLLHLVKAELIADAFLPWVLDETRGPHDPTLTRALQADSFRESFVPVWWLRDPN